MNKDKIFHILLLIIEISSVFAVFYFIRRIEYVKYENVNYRYSLEYPKKWVISDKSQNGDGASFDVGRKDVDTRVFTSLDDSGLSSIDSNYSKQNLVLLNGDKAFLYEYYGKDNSYLKVVLKKGDRIYTFYVSAPEEYIKNNINLLIKIGRSLSVKNNFNSTFRFSDRDIVLHFKVEIEDFMIDEDNSCIDKDNDNISCEKYVKNGDFYVLNMVSGENKIEIVDQKYFDSNFKDKKYTEKYDDGSGSVLHENTFLMSQIKLKNGIQDLISIKENVKAVASLKDGIKSSTEKDFIQCAFKLKDGKYFFVHTISSGLDQSVDNCDHLINNLESVEEVDYK